MLKDIIRAKRKEKNMTQKELAEKVGLTASTITKYEKGLLEPNIETLNKIADVLNVTINDLIGDDFIIGASEKGITIKSLQEIQERVIKDLISYCAIKDIDISLVGDEENFVFENVVKNFVALSTAFSCSPMKNRIKEINNTINRYDIDFNNNKE